MIKKIQYTTQEERKKAIDDNENLTLSVECCSIDGNFLTFSDDITIIMQIQNLSNTVNMILLKQEGII